MQCTCYARIGATVVNKSPVVIETKTTGAWTRIGVSLEGKQETLFLLFNYFQNNSNYRVLNKVVGLHYIKLILLILTQTLTKSKKKSLLIIIQI